MRVAALMIAVASAGCWKTPATPPPPARDAGEPVVGGDDRAATRARHIVETQLAAASSEGAPQEPEARDAALRATFAPGAKFLRPIAVRPVETLEAIQFDRISIKTLEAGGTPDVVWFLVTFQDDATENFRNPTDPTAWFPARYAGVATRSAGWKVVAASLQMSSIGQVQGNGTIEADPIADGTKGGALAALVLDGPALAKVLPPTGAVVALGDALTRGAVGLGPWGDRKLAPDPDVNEVTTPTWGLVQARVAFSTGHDHGNLGIFALALPRPDGRWVPIFVQYLAY